MIVDLHAHYPMHVVTDLEPHTTVARMTRVRERATLGDRLRAFVLKMARMVASDRSWWSGYRMSVPYLEQGKAGVALWVLYRPFSELDFDVPYGSPPQPSYFSGLIKDLELVEDEVASHSPAKIRIAHSGDELERALSEGATALIHVVEGGFHLGGNPEEIDQNVAELARRGVAYVTLAHLFFRDIATNAPAIPFLSDRLYNRLFPQPSGEALTHLGRPAVRSMVRHHVMVDVSHMCADALTATLDLLDKEDPHKQLPVLASHAGYRFGSQEYMLDRHVITRIKARGGVIGLIMAQHQLNDGIRRNRTKNLRRVVRGHPPSHRRDPQDPRPRIKANVRTGGTSPARSIRYAAGPGFARAPAVGMFLGPRRLTRERTAAIESRLGAARIDRRQPAPRSR